MLDAKVDAAREAVAQTELAVRDMVHGRPVTNRDALVNPEALDLFRDLAELERELPKVFEAALASSARKPDISQEEAASETFLQLVKAKSWNKFYRDCFSVSYGLSRFYDGHFF